MLNDRLSGATAGLNASTPMTWVREALFRVLPRCEQHPLPPSITAMLADTFQGSGLGRRTDRW